MTKKTQAILAAGKAALDEAKAKRNAERATRYPSQATNEAKMDATPAPKGAKTTKTLAKATAVFVARTLPKGATATVLKLGERPTKNPALAAHTQAAFAVLGMFSEKRGSAPETLLLSFLGQTAVKHHLKENNLSVKDGLVSLTPAGYGHFRARKVNPELANAFVGMFIDGEIAPALMDIGIVKRLTYTVA